MAVLPPSDATAPFIMAHQDKIANEFDLLRMLGYLEVDKRYDFLWANEHRIKSGDNLHDLMNYIPENGGERMAFAIRHQGKITRSGALACVLKLLDESQRLPFASRHAYLIKDGQDLHWIIKFLPTESRTAFARTYQGVIHNGRYLDEILDCIPEADRFAFACDNVCKCNNMSEIILVIKRFCLPQQRYALVVACQATILASVDMHNLSVLLDRAALIKFISANIGSISHLIYYLDLLPSNQRVTAIVGHENLLNNYGALRQIIKLLGLADRLQLARAKRQLIKTVTDLVDILVNFVRWIACLFCSKMNWELLMLMN